MTPARLLGRWPAALALLLLLLAAVGPSAGFESDEVDDDYEEPAGMQNTITVSRRGGGQSTVNFVLEHNLGADGAWSTGGRFTARVVDGEGDRGQKGLRIQGLRLAREDLEDDERAVFESLVHEDRYYKVRVQSDVLEYKPGGSKVFSSVKARCLVDAGMMEHFVLQMDEDGHVVSLTIAPPSGECRTDLDVDVPSQWSFSSSTAAVKYAKDAPRLHLDMMHRSQGAQPAHGSSHSNVPGDGEGGVKEKKPDNRSFIAKYWIYIIPAMMILSNIMGAPEQQGRGGGARR